MIYGLVAWLITGFVPRLHFCNTVIVYVTDTDSEYQALQLYPFHHDISLLASNALSTNSPPLTTSLRPYHSMSSALDDEDLSISISSSSARRGSNMPQDQPPAVRSTQPSAAAQQRAEQVKERTNGRLGQYTIVRTLGEGSFGKVKLAVHQVSGQKVALKIISRRKLVTRDMAGRIEREIQYLQLLRHPHIIKL